MYAVSTAVMRDADEEACGQIGAIELIRRVSECLLRELSGRDNICIVCGSGNNGADGYALAYLLGQKNITYSLYPIRPTKSEEAKYYQDKIIADNCIDGREFVENINNYDVIVDCILGIGMRGELAYEYVKIINVINSSGAFIVSCDIPNGLNSDNGRAYSVAINANITLAIGALKSGYYLNDGKDYCGKIVFADIGITNYSEIFNIVNDKMVAEIFPPRRNNTHKGSNGNLIIVADSTNYIGAGILASCAALSVLGEVAMRSGTGYCKLCVPDNLFDPLSRHIIHVSLLRRNQLETEKPTAVAFGMGLERCDSAILEKLCLGTVPLLIDAEGLNMLSKNLNWLKNKKCPIIITPHVKEMSRLTGESVDSILNNPIEITRKFARKYNVTALLKGATTVVTDGDNVNLVINGTPSLAKGGSGDVLSGTIGALLARGIPPFIAAYSGAYICAEASRIAAEKLGEYSVCPLDVAEAIKNIANINKNV